LAHARPYVRARPPNGHRFSEFSLTVRILKAGVFRSRRSWAQGVYVRGFVIIDATDQRVGMMAAGRWIYARFAGAHARVECGPEIAPVVDSAATCIK
jgi:hypothetical protein